MSEEWGGAEEMVVVVVVVCVWVFVWFENVVVVN